jgi:hypothetical protein
MRRTEFVMKLSYLDLKKSFWSLSIALAVTLGLPQAQAKVINAASLALADVSNAVASAAVGDIVLLPAGTNGWYGSTLVLSGVTLEGSTNGTTIRDETPVVLSGAGHTLIQINANAGFPTRITQIQFMFGVTNNLTSFANNYNPGITIGGQAANWRIDHCIFNLLSGKNIQVSSDAFGLVDHNSFYTKDRISVEVLGNGYGDADWAAPTQFGSANAVYIEDNYMWDGYNFGWVDVVGGGRCVFRHNNCTGCYFNTHGVETSLRYRSSRYVEVYNNFYSMPTNQYVNLFSMIDIRGGSAVVFSNTANGYWGFAVLHYYRTTDNDPYFTPWFGATGLSGWDSNGPALLSGTASVSSNSLVVPGAGWTTNQWVGCTVYNSVSNLCGVVVANDSSTMQFMASRSPRLQIGFNVGDPYVVHHVYPMLDQPGRGQGNLLSGDNPTPINLNQASEPVYVWGNTLRVNEAGLVSQPATVTTQYPNLVANQDFFNGVPRPNYTPYIYPHPLQSFTNTLAVSTNAPPPPPPPGTNTNSLTPPTGLNVRSL